MIKHLLLLQFKEQIDQKQIDSMFVKFTELKNTIDGINSIDYGTNQNPEKLNKDFTHAVEVTFTCLEARDNYLVHQDHKALQSILLDLLSDLIVFDIEC